MVATMLGDNLFGSFCLFGCFFRKMDWTRPIKSQKLVVNVYQPYQQIRLKIPLELSCLIPCSQQSCRSRLTQGCIQLSFKSLQGWRCYNLSGSLFQCLTTLPTAKSFFLYQAGISHLPTCIHPLVRPLYTAETSRASSSLYCPMRQLQTGIRSPQAFFTKVV